MTVLLIRPDDNAADERELAAHGCSTWTDPYLEVVLADRAVAVELATLLGATSADATPAATAPTPPVDKPAHRRTWLVLTSPRAYPLWAQLVGEQLLAAQMQKAAAAGAGCAVVGERTAQSLPQFPWSTLQYGQPATANGLLDTLRQLPPGHAIIPVSARANTVLTTGLTTAGWQVSSAPIYTVRTVTTEPASAAAVRSGQVEAVVLYSPSAVAALLHWAVPAPKVRLIAAGPTTAAAAQAYGLQVETAPETSSAAVAATIAKTNGANRH